MYFIRHNIHIQQWNFTSKIQYFVLIYFLRFCYLASSFQNVVNRQIFTGNLINVQTIRKEKFPRDFFSEVK